MVMRRPHVVVVLAVAACTACEVTPPPGSDPNESLCEAPLTTLDVSRSPLAFAKSASWSFFPGDVNGDGIDDLVVEDERGLHFFFRPAVLTEDPAIDVDAILAGVGGFSITTQALPWTHRLASISGDVNGDGRDDVVLMRDDLASIVVLFAPASTAAIDVATIGGATPGLEITSSDFLWNDLFFDGHQGVEVTEVADLDGDGLAEVVVGLGLVVGEGDLVDGLWLVPGRAASAIIDLEVAPEVHHLYAARGRAVDLDGDGVPELAALINDYDTSTIRIARAPFDAFEGGGILDAVDLDVADVDGDGRGDIVYRHGPEGSFGGLGEGAVLFGRGWPLESDLQAPEGEAFSISSEDTTGYVTIEVLGDVNGDGRDDLLITPRLDTPTGLAHVVFGKDDTNPVRVGRGLQGADGFALTGSVLAGDLARAGPAGDVDHDGRADYWIAAHGDDADEEFVVLASLRPDLERCDDGPRPAGGPGEGSGSLLWTYTETSPAGGSIAAHDLAVADDGTVTIAGEVSLVVDDAGYGERADHILVRALAPDGTPRWSIVESNPDGKHPDRANAVAIADGDEPIVVGVAGAKWENVWVRRFSAAGEPRWTTAIGDAPGSSWGAGRAITGLGDGTFVIASEILEPDGGGIPLLMRIDGDGVRLDDFGWNPWLDTRSVACDLAFAGGRLYAVGSRDLGAGLRNSWVGAFTADLESLWLIEGPSERAEVLTSIDGDLIVAGVTLSDVNPDGQGWIRRISGADGALRWHQDLDGTRGQRIRDLAVTDEGDIIAVGEIVGPPMSAWIVRIDGDGDERWGFEASIEVDGLTEARALAIDGERFYVAGNATDDVGDERLWVQARAL